MLHGVMEQAPGDGTAQPGRALHPSALFPFCSVRPGRAFPGTAVMGAGGVNGAQAPHR